MLFPGYSLITNEGYCQHVDGGFPSYCYSNSKSRITSCETYCTNKTSCVGYEYSAKHCNLFTTDNTCPSEFQFTLQTNTAETMNDLIAISYTGYVCYGRYPGKLIFRF